MESAQPLDGHHRRRPPTDGSILRDPAAALEAIEAERTDVGVCRRLCKALVAVVGATACTASRVDEAYLVGLTSHALRDVALGRDAAYRISDFPLTDEVLRTGEPRTASFADEDIDASEAVLLRELGMRALLMLPLRVRGRPWGLVELYEMRLRRFSEDDVAVAGLLTTAAERRLAAVAGSELPRRRPPVYELPSEARGPRAPRTR